MLSIDTEDLISLAEVLNIIPKRPNKKPLHISAVYRWTKRGVSGIRLEVLQTPYGKYTSRQAVNRFFQALTAAQADTKMPAVNESYSSKSQRRSHDRRVESVLDAAGI